MCRFTSACCLLSLLITFCACGDAAVTEREGEPSDCPVTISEDASSAQGSSVVFNEFVADPDFIELHNVGDQPANLSGWSIVDGSDPSLAGTVYTFPDNALLEADGYVVLTRDYDLPFGIAGGDDFQLLNASGEQVDTVDMQERDTSCRAPNGTGVFQECGAQSLCEPNG